MRLAALLIVLGIALIAFGMLNPNVGKTLYPAGTTFSTFETGPPGPTVSAVIVYAGAAITALGVLLVTVRLVRR